MRRGIFNPLLYGKRLFQQFAVDMYIKVESTRLDFIRRHQVEIRADLYKGVVDSIHLERAVQAGRQAILCSKHHSLGAIGT